MTALAMTAMRTTMVTVFPMMKMKTEIPTAMEPPISVNLNYSERTLM
jgi:hypothetical protein